MGWGEASLKKNLPNMIMPVDAFFKAFSAFFVQKILKIHDDYFTWNHVFRWCFADELIILQFGASV